MLVIKGKSMLDAYKKAIKEVVENGEKVSPRGSSTIEIAPATIVIEDARKLLAAPKARKINPCFGIAETLWFLRGSNSLEEISHYNSVWNYFEDDDNKGILNGAYGERLRNWKGVDQIEEIYTKLKKDPYSRQAMAVIFDPVRDNKIHSNGKYSKDIPCTSYFNFHIRDGKLNMHVVMRSNDLHKGFIYDAHNFMIIQNILAGWLEVEVGKYTHTASSLHIYESDMENMLDVLNSIDEDVYDNMEEIPKIGLNKEEFDKTIELINEIEKGSRELVNKKLKDYEFISELFKYINLARDIESDYWRGIAGCLITYNARKAKIKKHLWLSIVETYITKEYYDLFANLSDLSIKK